MTKQYVLISAGQVRQKIVNKKNNLVRTKLFIFFFLKAVVMLSDLLLSLRNVLALSLAFQS